MWLQSQENRTYDLQQLKLFTCKKYFEYSEAKSGSRRFSMIQSKKFSVLLPQEGRMKGHATNSSSPMYDCGGCVWADMWGNLVLIMAQTTNGEMIAP